MKWLVRVAVLCALTSVAWAGWHALGGKGSLSVHTTPLTRGPLSLTVSATGKLAPTTQVLVGCEVSGTVEDVLVDFNDEVHRGQVIARIRPEYYQAQFDQAQAELAKATANLAQLKVHQQEAQRECQRVAKLRTTGAITEQEYDVKQTAAEAAKAAVAVGEASVQAAQSQVHLAHYQLQRAVITSPIDGIVLDRRVDVGQTLAASLQTPVLFVLAENLSQMDLLADVSEADVGYIRAGQPVTFTVNAYRDRTFEGRVKEVRNQPHTVGDVVNYTVVISVANQEHLFRPGMPADVTIQMVHQDDALKIANAALRFRPPLSPDVIRHRVEQMNWPTPPEGLRVLGTSPAATEPAQAARPPLLAPAKGTLWQYIGGQWKAVPVWTLYTDNRQTAVYIGQDIGQDSNFVTEATSAAPGKNTLEQALYLANPQNRKL